jgi:hypothetical protein
MCKREATRFDQALQQVAQGEPIEEKLRPLVDTAQQVSILAGPPPLPPHQLAPGRQRFLTEAAQLRAEKADRSKEKGQAPVMMKLGAALAVLVLVVGLLFGGGQVVADSLPGESLYRLELALEQMRLTLTASAQARAELELVLAEERLDEITALVEQGRTVADSVPARIEHQLRAALMAAVRLDDQSTAQVLRRLDASLQQRQQTIMALMERTPDSEQTQLRRILRIVEQVRQEARDGQADPGGLRRGAPSDPSDLPGPWLEQTGERPTESPGTDPVPSPSLTREPGAPGARSQPHEDGGAGAAPTLADPPVGPRPAELPGYSPGPRPTDELDEPKPAYRPGGNQGIGPQPADVPAGPKPDDQPGDGSSSRPTEELGGPNGNEPGGPNSTDESGGPSSPDEPGGPDSPDEPGGPSSPAEPGGPNAPLEPGGPNSVEEQGNGAAPGPGSTDGSDSSGPTEPPGAGSNAAATAENNRDGHKRP